MDNELNQTITSIHLQIQDIQEKLNLIQNNYSTLLDDDILSRFNTLSQNIATLSNNYNSLYTTATNTANLINSSTISTIQDDLLDAQVDISSLQQSLATLSQTTTTNINSMSSDITTLQNNIATIQSNISQLSAQLNNISIPTFDTTSIDSSITQLQNDISSINSTISSISASINSLDSSNLTNQADIATLQTNYNSITNNMNILIGNINDMQEIISAISTQCNQVVDTVSSYSQTISALNHALERIQPALASAEQNASDISQLGQTVTGIQSSLLDISQTITSLSSAISSNSSTISTLSSTVNGFSSTISTMSTDVLTNTSSISTLSTQISQLDTRVTALENQLSTLIQTLTDTPCSNSGNMCGCNYKFSLIDGEIDEIKDILAIHYPEQDNDRIGGVQYIDVDRENNIFCTEDYTEITGMDRNSVRNIILSAFAVACNPTNQGRFDFELDMEYTRVFNFYFDVYLNGTRIMHDALDCSTLNEVVHYTKTLEDLTLTSGNIIMVMISSNANMYYHPKGISFKVTAPNARILNKEQQVNIDCFDNMYYFSDCRSGSIKYAEKPTNSIVRTGNIRLTDLNINARSYRTFVSCIKNEDNTYSKGNIYRCKGNINGNTTSFYGDFEGGPTTEESCLNATYFQSKHTSNAQICYGGIYPTTNTSSNSFGYNIDLYTKPTTLNFSTSAYNLNTPAGPIAVCDSVRYMQHNYWQCPSYGWMGIYQKYDGSILVLTNMYSYNTSIRFDAGYGVNPKLYCVNPTENIYDLYCNVFGKIIRKRLKLTPYSSFRLVETEEIGYYDDYFKGANNDYFVMKNGQLHYYKEPTI